MTCHLSGSTSAVGQLSQIVKPGLHAWQAWLLAAYCPLLLPSPPAVHACMVLQVAVKCLSPSALATSHRSSGRGSDQAAAELLQVAATLASLHHPNLVTCFGVILSPTDTEGEAAEVSSSSSFAQCGADFSERDTAAAVWGGAALRQPTASSRANSRGSQLPNSLSGAGSVHPSAPAIVTEYMSAGSLRQAISNKAEWLNSNLAKAKLLLDTAKVGDCSTASLVDMTRAVTLVVVLLPAVLHGPTTRPARRFAGATSKAAHLGKRVQHRWPLLLCVMGSCSACCTLLPYAHAKLMKHRLVWVEHTLPAPCTLNSGVLLCIAMLSSCRASCTCTTGRLSILT